jgi:putative endonuclease
MKIYQFYVYILTSASNTVVYVGVTNNLKRRCYEHKQRRIKGFTKKSNIDKLIYFEEFDLIESAIAREKQIKGYSRAKKNALIESVNKDWLELNPKQRLHQAK